MKCNTEFIRNNNSRLPIVIRKATPDDYPAVCALEEMEFAVHQTARPDYFASPEGSYTKEEFAELLSHPCPVCWVAVYKGAIVGLCFGKIEKTPDNPIFQSRVVAFIQDLITQPEYRGKGVATALMEKAQEQAILEHAVSMELCVWNFNRNAVQLYEKMGMKVQYYHMEKSLTSHEGE